MSASNPKSASPPTSIGVICVGLAVTVSLTSIAHAANPGVEQRHQSWRAVIAHTPTPGSGCFMASYPVESWREVPCGPVPKHLYLPRSGEPAPIVGNGDDYAAQTTTLTSAATGWFPRVSHLRSETDNGQNNIYSIQLNSNRIPNDAACSGAYVPGQCRGWLQFVYFNGPGVDHGAYIQYWLLYYTGGTVNCPSGWTKYGISCYRFSRSVSIPSHPIKTLSQLSLSGDAVAGGLDTLKFMDDNNAYSTDVEDSEVDLADGWTGSEFNAFGDGGGSEAVFNAKTSLTVEIDLTDGSTDAPTCKAYGGTTAETNNLNLKKCTASGGTVPSVTFKESLKKT